MFALLPSLIAVWGSWRGIKYCSKLSRRIIFGDLSQSMKRHYIDSLKCLRVLDSNNRKESGKFWRDQRSVELERFGFLLISLASLKCHATILFIGQHSWLLDAFEQESEILEKIFNNNELNMDLCDKAIQRISRLFVNFIEIDRWRN